MSKKKEFINKIGKLNASGKIISDIAEMIKEVFVEVYGHAWVDEKSCIEDNGFAYVPVWIHNRKKDEYFGLLDVCLKEEGAPYELLLLHSKHGWIKQKHFKKKLSSKEFDRFFPYKYKPLIKIVGDAHVDNYFSS